MALARRIVLASRPSGAPRPTDFAIDEVTASEPAPGQILVRNSCLSLDASARIRMAGVESDYLPPFAIGAPLDGWAVGQVVATASPAYEVGQYVLHQHGWRELAVISDAATAWGPPEIVDVTPDCPDRFYLGLLGPTGLTAYAGLVRVAELADGDVVFVSAAAGAVGSTVVQMAKALGHRVIASVGGSRKVRYVTDVLGADAAIDRLHGDLAGQLRAASPCGVDVYFDNVGGDHLEAALECMRPGGRIALCGAVGSYNDDGPTSGPRNLFEAVVKGITLRGYLARSFVSDYATERAHARDWLARGAISNVETVVHGLEQAPRAFIDMLAGHTLGKTVVTV